MGRNEQILDFNQPAVRNTVKRMVDALRGLYWFECRRARDQRTLAQNAYYFGVVLPKVAAGMTEAWGETIDPDEAHEFLKDKFLKKPIVNRSTGEVTGHTVPSTANKDIQEFCEYLDKIIAFSADYLNTEIPIALRPARPAEVAS